MEVLVNKHKGQGKNRRKKEKRKKKAAVREEGIRFRSNPPGQPTCLPGHTALQHACYWMPLTQNQPDGLDPYTLHAQQNPYTRTITSILGFQIRPHAFSLLHRSPEFHKPLCGLARSAAANVIGKSAQHNNKERVKAASAGIALVMAVPGVGLETRRLNHRTS